MMKTSLALIMSTFLASLSLAQGFGESEEPINTNPLTIQQATLSAESLKPGGMAELKIEFNLPESHRAYLDQFKLEVISPEGVYLSEFNVSPIVDFTDPVTKKIKKGTTGNGNLLTVLQLPSSFHAGRYEVDVRMTYQACTDEYCLFPTKVPVKFNLTVTGGTEDFFQKTLDRGWLYALAIVFLAGILTSLTPCIFPLIPITLAIIGSHESGHKKRHGFLVSLAYVLGIAVTYSILGVIAAKTGALFGGLLGHPVVVYGIAVLFILMGLSMYGFYEVKLPDQWAGALFQKKWQKGLVGAFGSGLIAGVVASPCVGPVLVSVLAYVAQTQDTLRGFVLLFVYALGLGQLFLVLGTFSQLTKRLPRSGPWMEKVKFIFGTTMIAMALYYVYPVTHSALFDGLIATALLAISTFFGAFRRLSQFEHHSRLFQALMVIVFIMGLVFAVKALIPAHMEPRGWGQSTAENPSYPNPEWFTYSDTLMQQAAAEGRPVILDFKADWCLACKELEQYTFSDAEVIETGKHILWLEFDATKPSDELDALKKRYNILGLPAVLFFDSNGKWRTDLTLTGFETAPEFLKRLRAVR